MPDQNFSGRSRSGASRELCQVIRYWEEASSKKIFGAP